MRKSGTDLSRILQPAASLIVRPEPQEVWLNIRHNFHEVLSSNFKIAFPAEMPKFPDDPASRFLDYYGRYLSAKKQNEPMAIWLFLILSPSDL